jgi:hypothetical protein
MLKSVKSIIINALINKLIGQNSYLIQFDYLEKTI